MNLRKITYVGERQTFLRKRVTGKSVLHLGCTGSPDVDGRIERGESMHMNLLHTARTVYGVDLDPDAVAKMRDVYGVRNLYVGNVEQLEQLSLEGMSQFDIILAAELIEHLNCPGKMLEGVKRFMNPSSRLMISTPNSLSAKYFLHAFWGREVQGPDHTIIISPATGTLLFNMRYGFKIYSIFSCLEAHSRWANRITKPIFSALFSFAPWYADGLIFELGV